MPRIKLTRAPLRAKKPPPVQGHIRVNTTHRAAHCLSPPQWLVGGYQGGQISDLLYGYIYRDRLELTRSEAKSWMIGLIMEGVTHVTLLCYCGDGKFCHTNLAIDWLCDQFPGDFEDGR